MDRAAKYPEESFTVIGMCWRSHGRSARVMHCHGRVMEVPEGTGGVIHCHHKSWQVMEESWKYPEESFTVMASPAIKPEESFTVIAL